MRTGLNVEHEVHRPTAQEHLEHFAQRCQQTLLNHDRGQHGHSVQETHAREHHLSVGMPGGWRWGGGGGGGGCGGLGVRGMEVGKGAGGVRIKHREVSSVLKRATSDQIYHVRGLVH